MKLGKNGSAPRVSGGRRTTSPTARDREAASARARWLGVQPSSAAAARIRSRVSGATPGRSLSAKDTAPFDTPALRATSEMVGRRVAIRPLKRFSYPDVKIASFARLAGSGEIQAEFACI